MKSKNGFLLIELIVGLAISVFFMTIITHYIIEVKYTQYKAIKKIEDISTARNKIQGMYMKRHS